MMTGNQSLVHEVTRNQLLSWGVLTNKDEHVAPTNAFALLTGHYLLPTITQCALFKGKSKGLFLDKREYEVTNPGAAGRGIPVCSAEY